MSGRFDGEQTNTWNADENKLAQVLNTVDIGGLVSQSLFAKGFRTVLSAATTSTQSWAAVTHSAVGPASQLLLLRDADEDRKSGTFMPENSLPTDLPRSSLQ